MFPLRDRMPAERMFAFWNMLPLKWGVGGIVYRRNMALWYAYLIIKVQKNAAAGIFPARRTAEQD